MYEREITTVDWLTFYAKTATNERSEFDRGYIWCTCSNNNWFNNVLVNTKYITSATILWYDSDRCTDGTDNCDMLYQK